MKKAICAVATLAFALTLNMSPAGATPKSKYGKFKNGVGNCIFSASPLPLDKESTYKGLATSFIAEKVSMVYARCYFPETVKQLGKHGKLFNSIRDRKDFNIWYKMGGYGGDMVRNVANKVSAKNEKWTQNYHWFCASKKCDLRKDMRKKVLFKYKGLMKGSKKKTTKLPFKEKFCVQVSYDRADKYKSLVTKTLDIKSAPIAEGCFEYVLTKGE